tara:strand:+ start:294 stop:776 length:483 start_codon:yes stop_codon:yes gene_type:complete
MAKNTTRHTEPINNDIVDIQEGSKNLNLTPKALTKQEFGKRVYKLMVGKGMTQSELARAAGIGRDSISTYIKGRSIPDPKNLEALATALHVSVNELFPNGKQQAMDNEIPALDLRMSHSDPNMAWLQINRSLSLEIALKIITIIKDADEKAISKLTEIKK